MYILVLVNPQLTQVSKDIYNYCTDKFLYQNTTINQYYFYDFIKMMAYPNSLLAIIFVNQIVGKQILKQGFRKRITLLCSLFVDVVSKQTEHSSIFVSRMAGSAVHGCGAADLSGDGGLLPAQVYQGHGGHGRAGGCSGLPLHLLRLAVPSAVLQLWWVSEWYGMHNAKSCIPILIALKPVKSKIALPVICAQL